MELEWVFFSVTPTAVSASRMDLLFTSSSRARSLIRTLLIRPFSLPCALSCSYQPHRGRNFIISVIPEIIVSSRQGWLSFVASAASHDHVRRSRYPRRRLPGFHQPG